MYITQSNNPEPHNPISTQYPLRPASRISPIRINVLKSLRLHTVTVASTGGARLFLGLGLAVIAKHKPRTYSGGQLRSTFRLLLSRRWSTIASSSFPTTPTFNKPFTPSTATTLWPRRHPAACLPEAGSTPAKSERRRRVASAGSSEYRIVSA